MVKSTASGILNLCSIARILSEAMEAMPMKFITKQYMIRMTLASILNPPVILHRAIPMISAVGYLRKKEKLTSSRNSPDNITAVGYARRTRGRVLKQYKH